MAASAKEKRQFIGLVLISWFGFAVAYAWFMGRPWLERQDWATTEGDVIGVSILDAPFGHGECQEARKRPESEILMVQVRYEFEVDGKRYASDQFTHEHRGSVECYRKDAIAT